MVAGVLLAELSLIALFIALRRSWRMRRRLRMMTGASMPPLLAEVIVIGGSIGALAAGLWLIWKSGRL